jgi:hypothetical protein
MLVSVAEAMLRAAGCTITRVEFRSHPDGDDVEVNATAKGRPFIAAGRDLGEAIEVLLAQVDAYERWVKPLTEMWERWDLGGEA